MFHGCNQSDFFISTALHHNKNYSVLKIFFDNLHNLHHAEGKNGAYSGQKPIAKIFVTS